MNPKNITPYNGDAFRHEVAELFDAKKKRKSTAGIRAKRKGRNLGGARVRR